MNKSEYINYLSCHCVQNRWQKQLKESCDLAHRFRRSQSLVTQRYARAKTPGRQESRMMYKWCDLGLQCNPVTFVLHMYWNLHACMCAHIPHMNKLLLSMNAFSRPLLRLLSPLPLYLPLPHISCIPPIIWLQLRISLRVCVGISQYLTFNITYECFLCMEPCLKLGTVHREPERCKWNNRICISSFHLNPRCFCVYMHKWSFDEMHSK